MPAANQRPCSSRRNPAPDARPAGLPARCDNAGCHTSTPHGNVTNGTQLNRHTTKVACQTCHIAEDF